MGRAGIRIPAALALLVASHLVGVGDSRAQPAFPSRPITIMVPAAAGGPTDTVARLVAESMSRSLGQQVIVENVGGAGGTIGIARLVKAAPDGHSLLVWHIAQATAPALYDKLPYDVLKDFDAIGRIADVPMTVVSRADLPAKDISELLAFVRDKKRATTYGHAGIGSASHLCALMLMSALDTPMTGVGYRGTGPAMNDLLSGQFDVMCDQTTNTTNQIKAGKIKGYAVTTRTRVSSVAELPTLDESGLTGFEVSAWHAVWAPRGLPQDVSEKLVAALQAAVKDPKLIERLAALGTEPVKPDLATPQALRKQLEAEVAKWGQVIRAAGVKAN